MGGSRARNDSVCFFKIAALVTKGLAEQGKNITEEEVLKAMNLERVKKIPSGAKMPRGANSKCAYVFTRQKGDFKKGDVCGAPAVDGLCTTHRNTMKNREAKEKQKMPDDSSSTTASTPSAEEAAPVADEAATEVEHLRPRLSQRRLGLKRR